MRPSLHAVFVLGWLALAAAGCATTHEPKADVVEAGLAQREAVGADTAGAGDESGKVGEAPVAPAVAARPPVRTRRILLGFGGYNLFSLELTPDRNTARLLDLKLFHLIEAGGGENGYSFGLLESPVFQLFAARRDGPSSELKLLDLKLLALVSREASGPDAGTTKILKLPLIGSFYGHDRTRSSDHWNFLYLVHHETER